MFKSRRALECHQIKASPFVFPARSTICGASRLIRPNRHPDPLCREVHSFCRCRTVCRRGALYWFCRWQLRLPTADNPVWGSEHFNLSSLAILQAFMDHGLDAVSPRPFEKPLSWTWREDRQPKDFASRRDGLRQICGIARQTSHRGEV